MLNRVLFENGDESPKKLENLSPQKFGKAAFTLNYYTPSRLAENSLYKDVLTLKKVEDNLSKIRQFESTNSFLNEKLHKMQTEMNGIEMSLSQQILMYKKMLHETEITHEQRLLEVQRKFGLQMKVIIEEKQQEVKYVQSQKQGLERIIDDLNHKIKELQEEINHFSGDASAAKSDNEKLLIRYKNLQEKIVSLEHQKANQEKKAREDYQELSKRFSSAQKNWINQIQNVVTSKDRERQNVERIFKTQIEKIENQRAADSLNKSQQLKQTTMALDSQIQSLRGKIEMKDRLIQGLNLQNGKEKENLLEITKIYESQLTHLQAQKNYLSEQNEILKKDNESMGQHIKREEDRHNSAVMGLQKYIEQLKEAVKMNQLNYVHERNRFDLTLGDCEQEMFRLKSESANISEIMHENSLMVQQIRSLRELLMESSYQIEKSKQEIIRLSQQKSDLLMDRIDYRVNPNIPQYRTHREDIYYNRPRENPYMNAYLP